MGGMQRRKGATGERELVDLLNRLGFLARRTAQYCGNSGDAADIVIRDLPFHAEVKRTERLKWRDTLRQVQRDAKGKPWVIFHRQSNMPWLVIMEVGAWADDSTAARYARELKRKQLDEVATREVHPCAEVREGVQGEGEAPNRRDVDRTA